MFILSRGSVTAADKHAAVPIMNATLVKADKKEELKYPVAVSYEKNNACDLKNVSRIISAKAEKQYTLNFFFIWQILFKFSSSLL